MSASSPDLKATGTQLLSSILEQLELHTDALDQICARLDRIHEALCAPSPPDGPNGTHPTAGGQIVEFDAEEIVMTVSDAGVRQCRIKGGPFRQWGIRVWPEVLPELGIDPEKLPFGTSPFQKRVRALVGVAGKQKILGIANGGSP
jgi:hypothetical protein